MKYHLLLLASLFGSLTADIRPTATLDVIAEEAAKSPQHSWLLIDVGGTLLVHRDPVLHCAYDTWKRNWFQEHYPQMTKQERVELVKVVEENPQSWVLTDATWPDLIRNAQSMGIKPMAFTKVLVLDPSLNRIRIEKLQHFNLLFQDELGTSDTGHSLYHYISGIIQTDAPLKGPSLKALITDQEHLPPKILFVDDRIEQLQSVEQACSELGIPYLGFHYIATREAPLLDESIAHKQLQTLVTEHKWVPYDEF